MSKLLHYQIYLPTKPATSSPKRLKCSVSCNACGGARWNSWSWFHLGPSFGHGNNVESELRMGDISLFVSLSFSVIQSQIINHRHIAWPSGWNAAWEPTSCQSVGLQAPVLDAAHSSLLTHITWQAVGDAIHMASCGRSGFSSWIPESVHGKSHSLPFK